MSTNDGEKKGKTKEKTRAIGTIVQIQTIVGLEEMLLVIYLFVSSL